MSRISMVLGLGVLLVGGVARGQTAAPWGGTAPPAPPAARPKTGTVFDVRVGIVVGGGGDIALDCSGSPACADLPDETSYDDQSGVSIGGDVLVRMGPNLRLGGGLVYELDTEVETKEKADLGTDLGILGIIEGVFPAGPTIDLAARGIVGPLILVPGGDLEDSADDAERACDDGSNPYGYGYGGVSCDIDHGPFWGWTVGAGGGLLVALQGVSLRLDFVAQYLSITVLDGRFEGGGETVELSGTMSGTRFWLGAGIEL